MNYDPDRFRAYVEDLACHAVNRHALHWHPKQKNKKHEEDLYYEKRDPIFAQMLIGKSRIRPLAIARQIVWTHLYYHPISVLSLTRIGQMYNRDHTTVLAGINRIKGCVDCSPQSMHAKAYLDAHRWICAVYPWKDQ